LIGDVRDLIVHRFLKRVERGVQLQLRGILPAISNTSTGAGVVTVHPSPGSTGSWGNHGATAAAIA